MGYAERKEQSLQGNVPNLRFPEFSGEWEHVALSEIAARVTRKNKDNASKLPLTISAQYGLVDQISFFNKVVASADMSNYYLLRQGEFAYNKSYSSDYPWGAIKRLDGYPQGALSSLYICFAVNDKVDSDFAVHYFESSKWHREVSNIAGEGARNHGLLNIAVGDFFDTKHRLPSSKEEQKKIAALLNLITERIATQIKIIEDLKKLKSAITHLHFDAAIDKYYSAYIGDCIEQVSQRNKDGKVKEVLSVSNKNGFVNQSEQFEDREIASEDTSNYKVVHTNDFAYNPARINVGSVARLHNYACGIVSPMYICFHTKPMLLPEYFEHIFSTSYFRHEMHKRLEGSVRLCLTYDSLCNIKIALPSIDEQKQFVSQISAIISKIINEDRLLTLYQTLKRYLLSQVFI